MDFETTADKLILYNLNDNKVLFEENADEKAPIASLTKIMTTILAIEKNDLTKTVEITNEMIQVPYDYVVVNLRVGQRLSLEELLYLTMLPSGADAAQALAVATGGSLSGFVEMMNQKASDLGLSNTHFNNAMGEDENNYSTARDVATLLKYALKNETFKTVFESFSYYSPSLDLRYEKTIEPGSVIKGAKTGYTGPAGRCLASTATINDVNYLLVNLNSSSVTAMNHVEDALTVYNYYSSHYGYQTIKKEGDKILDLAVEDSATKNLEIYAKEDINAYLLNDFDMSTLTYNYDGIDTIDNKNKLGDFLGTYTIYNEDDLLYETSIYFETEIAFYPYWLWNTGVAIGFGIIVLLLIRAILGRRRKAKKAARNFEIMFK